MEPHGAPGVPTPVVSEADASAASKPPPESNHSLTPSLAEGEHEGGSRPQFRVMSEPLKVPDLRISFSDDGDSREALVLRGETANRRTMTNAKRALSGTNLRRVSLFGELSSTGMSHLPVNT